MLGLQTVLSLCFLTLPTCLSSFQKDGWDRMTREENLNARYLHQELLLEALRARASWVRCPYVRPNWNLYPVWPKSLSSVARGTESYFSASYPEVILQTLVLLPTRSYVSSFSASDKPNLMIQDPSLYPTSSHPPNPPSITHSHSHTHTHTHKYPSPQASLLGHPHLGHGPVFG